MVRGLSREFLAAISDMLRCERDPLRHAANIIAELDSLFARGKCARRHSIAGAARFSER